MNCNYDEILKALACDNVPRLEVDHENQFAIDAVDGALPDRGQDADAVAGGGIGNSEAGGRSPARHCDRDCVGQLSGIAFAHLE